MKRKQKKKNKKTKTTEMEVNLEACLQSYGGLLTDAELSIQLSMDGT